MNPPTDRTPISMTQTPLAIHIEGLTKYYGRHLAVDNLSLTVESGQLFTFLGPNGAGKTTTIKVLTGLLRPTQGRSTIMGFDIQTDPVEAKRHIGYIPDHPYLYEKLTARDFHQFVADLFRIDRTTAAKRIEEYLTLFGLEDVQDDLIENHSHGMRQKLVFSVSLMHNPSVLIVDEPMVGLDPQSARTLKNLLRRKAREEGMAIFLSTHQLAVAEELADRISVIDHGRLIFTGTLEEMHREVGHAGNLEEMFLSLTGEETQTEQTRTR